MDNLIDVNNVFAEFKRTQPFKKDESQDARDARLGEEFILTRKTEEERQALKENLDFLKKNRSLITALTNKRNAQLDVDAMAKADEIWSKHGKEIADKNKAVIVAEGSINPFKTIPAFFARRDLKKMDGKVRELKTGLDEEQKSLVYWSLKEQLRRSLQAGAQQASQPTQPTPARPVQPPSRPTPHQQAPQPSRPTTGGSALRAGRAVSGR